MPTEDETTAIPHGAPIETSSSLHASCPPEEQIEAHAPREERVDSPLPEAISVNERHETRQDQPVDVDAQPGAIESSPQGKLGHSEDVTESPSPAGSPETSSDNDVRLARSMATAALGSSRSNGEDAPRYLSYPSLVGRRRVSILWNFSSEVEDEILTSVPSSYFLIPHHPSSTLVANSTEPSNRTDRCTTFKSK